MNADGAESPLSELSLAHCAPQKFTLVRSPCGVWLPITKTPPAGLAKLIVIVTVALPVLPGWLASPA